MALTKEALRALVALQEKDACLDSIQKEIDAVPPRIAALKADLEGEKRRVGAAKAKIIELEKKRKAKELDVAAKDGDARKHSSQLNEIKSNDAYKVLQAEIEKEKAAAGDIETEILQIMEEIDKARVEERAAAVEFKKTEEFFKKDSEKLEAELSHARGRFETAKAERDAAVAAVAAADPAGKFMKIYSHIRSRGKPDAVVSVVGGHCGACQVNLSQSLAQEMARLKTLVVCESCQRILYKSEQVAAAAAQ